MNDSIKISVIIPTLNRAKILHDALVSILNQSFPKDTYEVVVIDNGSSDNTKAIVDELSKEYGNHIKYFYDSRPGLLIGRHVGAQKARGEILLYADDDIIAPSEWVSEMYKCFFEDATVGIASGKVLPKFEIKPPGWIKLFPDIYLGVGDPGYQHIVSGVKFAFGGNLSIRKDVLYQAGGFNPDYMPGDLIKFAGNGESPLVAKVAKVGYKMVYNPKAYVHHLITAEKLTLDFFKKRAFFQGVADSYTIIRNSGGINVAAYKRILSRPAWRTTILNYLKCIKNGKVGFIKYYRYHKAVRTAYADGLRYHKSEVEKDPALLEWVLKENYLDV